MRIAVDLAPLEILSGLHLVLDAVALRQVDKRRERILGLPAGSTALLLLRLALKKVEVKEGGDLEIVELLDAVAVPQRLEDTPAQAQQDFLAGATERHVEGRADPLQFHGRLGGKAGARRHLVGHRSSPCRRPYEGGFHVRVRRAPAGAGPGPLPSASIGSHPHHRRTGACRTRRLRPATSTGGRSRGGQGRPSGCRPRTGPRPA